MWESRLAVWSQVMAPQHFHPIEMLTWVSSPFALSLSGSSLAESCCKNFSKVSLQEILQLLFGIVIHLFKNIFLLKTFFKTKFALEVRANNWMPALNCINVISFWTSNIPNTIPYRRTGTYWRTQKIHQMPINDTQNSMKLINPPNRKRDSILQHSVRI